MEDKKYIYIMLTFLKNSEGEESYLYSYSDRFIDNIKVYFISTGVKTGYFYKWIPDYTEPYTIESAYFKYEEK